MKISVDNSGKCIYNINCYFEAACIFLRAAKRVKYENLCA